MRHRIYHIVCLMCMALGCLCACQEETESGPSAGDGRTLVLNLETTAVQSRSAGEDEYNENKVAEADVFFFDTKNGECIYAQTRLTPVDGQLRVTLDNERVQFGGNYYIYVTANRGSNFADVTNETAVGKTIDELKATTITTEWKDGYQGEEEEDALLMDGETQVTISRETPSTVRLTRAMAKVALFPTVEAQIEVDGVIYKPMLDKMNVTLAYGVKRTNLAGNYEVNGTEDYVERMYRAYRAGSEGVGYTHVPFYSYPNPEDTPDRKNTYLILCVPWTMEKDGNTQSANYYYRVPIMGNEDPAPMARNRYYKVNVHVGVLGSLNPRDAVDLEGNLSILDWFSMEISADMEHYEYLVLDEYESVMNNESELEMPYISSSNLVEDTTRITRVTYPNYNDRSKPNQGYIGEVILTDSTAISQAGFSLEWDDDKLIFRHPVTMDDYVPFTITVEVKNTQGLTATWTITQYPSIYIVGDYNRDGDENRFVYGNRNGDPEDDNGTSLGGVYDPVASGATNKNKTQYTIYITAFDIEGSNYAIGDPRTSKVDKEVKNALDGKNDSQRKSLEYYYSTRKDSVDNVIAPAFKIASSWGVVNGYGISYLTAKKRCASYQENGYPAGRWRVPTEAEIQYIVSLSDRGVIPELFDGDYYASSGRYYDNESSPAGFRDGVNGRHSVRCVYDVWYWSNEKLSKPNQFTWGDEPMH